MPRKPRQKCETGIYHVMVRGINQQDIFHDEDDFKRYLGTLKKLSLECGVSILGYCLMTNHVHLLINEGDKDVSAFMKRLGVSYAYWYNLKYERTGHVFQDRFKSEGVENNAYLLKVIRYIHQNPVKAAIIQNPEEYCQRQLKIHPLWQTNFHPPRRFLFLIRRLLEKATTQLLFKPV